MRLLLRNRKRIRILGLVLAAVFLLGLIHPVHSEAATINKKLKGLYWDHQTKTADKQSTIIKAGKTYKLTLNKDKRHPGSYNGLIRFVLPKYGTYRIKMSNLKGGSYVAHQLYKKYNYGIGYASYFNGQQIDLVSKKYYKTLTGTSKAKSKTGTATSVAILEDTYYHYIYFMSDKKVSFTFKIYRVK